MTDFLKMDLASMGIVLSALGVSSCLGVIILPGLSDRLGRKPVIVAGLVLEIIGIWILMHSGSSVPRLFLVLTVVTMLIGGVICITIGPLASESVPAELEVTATGLIVGLGEIIGGALAPMVTGGIAVRAGIPVIMPLTLGAAVLALVIAALWIRCRAGHTWLRMWITPIDAACPDLPGPCAVVGR